MIDAFLRYITSEVQLSAATVSAYRTDLKQWADYSTDCGRYELRPESTTVSDLRQWISSLAKDGVSSRTIRRKIQSLRAFFRYMMRCHGMAVNPARDLVAPKMSKDLPVYVRTGEMEKMLDEPVDQNDLTEVRNHLILEMFYSTGLRCSELMTLLDRNVDSARSELKVVGKRNKERIVPLAPELVLMIDDYRRRCDSEGYVRGATLFSRPDGRALSRRQIYNIVHQAMETAGVHCSRKSPHILRHSFATDMLNGGAQLTSVQQLLGHESLNATQIYTHISYRDLKQNYQLAHPRAQKQQGG